MRLKSARTTNLRRPIFFKKIIEKIKYYYSGIHPQSEEGRIVSEWKDSLNERLQLFIDGVNAAARNLSNKENPTNDGGVKMMARTDITKLDIPWDSDNSSSIKSQINDHLDELKEMSPVIQFGFDKANGDYVQQLDEILKVWGYRLNRLDGISFLFDAEGIKSIRHYVHNDEEAAAAIVSPYVLKRGKAISGHINHKGKGTSSITIAAPVIINGQLGYEAVAIQFEKKGRVHSLRILDSDGRQFVFYENKKAKSPTNRAGSENESESDLPSDFSSNPIIPDSTENSNTQNRKNQSRTDSDFLAAVDRGDMDTAQKMVDEAAKEMVIPAGERRLYYQNQTTE